MAKSCLKCVRYLTCRDPQKTANFYCGDYKYNKRADSLNELISFAKPGNQFIGKDEFSGVNKDKVERRSKVRDPNEGQDFDIYSTIKRVVRQAAIVPTDIKIPDGDFRKAPNFFTFATHTNFLNVKPFLEQMATATLLFADHCVLCSDMDWFLLDRKVSDSLTKFERKVCLLENGVCPSCKLTRSLMVKEDTLNYYNSLAACWGQRSGKTAGVAMYSAYLTHLAIKLQRPNEVYNLLPTNVLHGTFVALTYAQASQNLWDPYYGYLTEAPWFQGYHQMLADVGARTGKELVKLKDTFVYYGHRRIIVYAAGPDKRILRGRTRFLCACDEIGWFENDRDSKKVKMNAHEIHVALENSLRTVRGAADRLLRQGFNDIPTGYSFNISSPSSARDKIMELVRQSDGSRKLLGVHKPTWEVNPTITRDDLAEEFKNDPIAAERDFGANPPLTGSPFIGSVVLLEKCYSDKHNQMQLSYKTSVRKDGTTTRYAVFKHLSKSTKSSLMAIDAGHVSNSFCCAIGSKIDDAHVQVDLLVEVQPKPGMPLNYTKVYEEILCPLIVNRSIKVVLADRWQSIKILSDLNSAYDIPADQVSLKYADIRLFKSFLEDRQLSLLAPKLSYDKILQLPIQSGLAYPDCFKAYPVEHFIYQCMTVQDNGKMVIKGDNLTDDLFRAVCLLVHGLTNSDYAEYLAGDEGPRPPIAVGMARTMTSGSGSNSGTEGSVYATSTGKVLGSFKRLGR